MADDDEESAECSSGNDEPQLEAEEADEEIEEFKVDKQGNHQVRIHRRRLSDVVEDEKKQLKFSNQDKGRKNGRNNRDVDDNALPKDKKTTYFNQLQSGTIQRRNRMRATSLSKTGLKFQMKSFQQTTPNSRHRDKTGAVEACNNLSL